MTSGISEEDLRLESIMRELLGSLATIQMMLDLTHFGLELSAQAVAENDDTTKSGA